MLKHFIFAASLAGLAVATPCAAQDAAESAAILSGTGQGTGAASRSLGDATTGAIGGATNAIRATRSGRAARASSGNSGNSRGGRNPASVGYAIPANIDPLDKFAVPTYRLRNGLQLRISGSFVPTPPTSCVLNCEIAPPA